VDFAEKIILKYDHIDKKINVQITDKKDIEMPVSICKGMEISDSPSCVFGTVELYPVNVRTKEIAKHCYSLAKYILRCYNDIII
jgi:hypothetical protein